MTDDLFRVGHQGRDQMYYEEQVDGAWCRIEIQGEMLMGAAHHVVYFASPTDWQKYPDWARHRREEIITRIKSRFHPPDYEYYEGGPVRQPTSAPPATWTPSERKAVRLAVVALLVFPIGAGWMLVSGIVNGVTTFPTKGMWGRSPMVRTEEPLLFWTCIGIYAFVVVASSWLARALMKSGSRTTAPRPRR